MPGRIDGGCRYRLDPAGQSTGALAALHRGHRAAPGRGVRAHLDTWPPGGRARTPGQRGHVHPPGRCSCPSACREVQDRADRPGAKASPDQSGHRRPRRPRPGMGPEGGDCRIRRAPGHARRRVVRGHGHVCPEAAFRFDDRGLGSHRERGRPGDRAEAGGRGAGRFKRPPARRSRWVHSGGHHRHRHEGPHHGLQHRGRAHVRLCGRGNDRAADPGRDTPRSRDQCAWRGVDAGARSPHRRYGRFQ